MVEQIMDSIDMVRILSEYKWALTTFLGAMIVASGALKASIDQKKSEQKATQLAEQLRDRTEELQRYQALTIELQGQAIEELKHQTSMLTGGNSYPLLIVNQDPEHPYLFKSELWVSGRYPLFNFSMSVHINNGPNNGETKTYAIDEVKQLSPMPINDLVFDLQSEPNISANIRFFARNGVWNEFITFRKTDSGEYQREIRLTPQHGQKEPLVYCKFEDRETSFGNMADFQSLKFPQQ